MDFLIILFIVLVLVYGDKLHKYQLRGMYEKEKQFMIGLFINETYSAFHADIMEEARMGNTVYEFNMFCYGANIHHFSFNMPPLGAEMNGLDSCLCASSMRKGVKQMCRIDHYRAFKREAQRKLGMDLFTLYKIEQNELVEGILSKLNESFPDSQLTKYHKNCCDYYILSWE